MVDPDPGSLMRWHAAATLGLVLDSCEAITADVHWAQSPIRDSGWNFAFTDSCRSLTAAEVEHAADIAVSRGREPAILHTEAGHVLPGWRIEETESWMWLPRGRPLAQPQAGSDLSVGVHERPTRAMVSVFEDVYIAPNEIRSDTASFRAALDAYKVGRATPPAQALHLEVRLAGRCAAIATISLIDNVAGLYFVGAHRAFRRRGLGSLVTAFACAEAFDRGAEGVFLQTVADSPVESLYAALGFRRQFIGHYIVRPRVRIAG